jgi:superfamily II DNA helicase RecQ
MLIFPTGHGKSLYNSIAAFHRSRVHDGFIQSLDHSSCSNFSLGSASVQYPVATWCSNHTPLNRPHILVVSKEDAVVALHNYLIKLHSESRLSRLVFDEFHTLASMRAHRDNVMRWLFTLRTEKTLVPSISYSSRPRLSMSRAREREINELSIIPTIRLASNRPNIKYSVISVRHTTMISNKMTLIASNPLPNEADHGIIYCPKKKLAEIFQHLKTVILHYLSYGST